MPRFNARQKANNFSYDNFENVINFAHLHNVKVYVAINTMIKENEIDACLKDVNFVISKNADAIIIQDLGIAKVISKQCPNFPIHLSTQCGISSFYGAKYAKEVIGASRIVLARETSLDEVKKITDNIDIEIEYFVQGALCVSYSGNCYFSSILGGNSGNRGLCKQPCRKIMKLSCRDKVIEGYNISTYDTCLIDELPKLIQAGITSFKIEGRLRSPSYVYYATKCYHDKVAIGEYNGSDFTNMKIAFNRGDYSKAYINGKNSKVIFNKVQGNIGVKIGKVIRKENGQVIIQTNKNIDIGDGFKILRNGYEIGGTTFNKKNFKNNKQFSLFSTNAQINDEVRKTFSINNENYVKSLNPKIPINVEYEILNNQEIKIIINEKFIYNSNIFPQSAKSSPITKEVVENQLSKLNNTDFVANSIVGDLDNDLFLAKSQINLLRRNAIAEYKKFVLRDKQNCEYSKIKIKNISNYSQNEKKSAAIVNEDTLFINADIGIFKPSEYLNYYFDRFMNTKYKEKYLYIFNYFTMKDFEIIENILQKYTFDGIYTDGYNGIEFARKHNLPYFLGTNTNIANNIFINETKPKYYAYSKELNNREISNMSSNGFVLALGGFSLMTFLHCPLNNSNISDCDKCLYNNQISYFDYAHREFKLYRNKINSCIFTLLNNIPIDARNKINKSNLLYDFSFYSKKEAEDIIGKKCETNSGHITRGVV